jgi:hypothetical protein
MNIFVLDLNQKEAAQYHVNKHVVKMITESNQMLCSAHHACGADPKVVPYRLGFKNHSCSKWVRESLSNYNWLVKLSLELCKEYTFRYDKIHAGEKISLWCEKNRPPIIDVGLTPFALAMPNEYKCEDPVKSYRNYYRGEKSHIFDWKKRNRPYWLEVNE